MDKLNVLKDYVLIKPDPDDNRTLSGIIIKDSEEYIPVTGVVEAVSDFVASTFPELKIGDNVLFKKLGPIEVELNNNELLLVPINDVLGIL